MFSARHEKWETEKEVLIDNDRFMLIYMIKVPCRDMMRIPHAEI